MSEIKTSDSCYSALLTSMKLRVVSVVGKEKFENILQEQRGVYPFNEFEFLVTHAITFGALTLEEYKELRNSYSQKHENLCLYEMPSRSFGDTWGQSHVIEVVPGFQTPRQFCDSEYDNEYDLLFEGLIKVELKASRAVTRHKEMRGKSLAEKALFVSSRDRYVFNLMQTKPYCCDVFMFLGVYTDEIRYWVFASHELQSQLAYTQKCHRGSRTDDMVHEGQIHIPSSRLEKLAQFEVTEKSAIADSIRAAYVREKTFRDTRN